MRLSLAQTVALGIVAVACGGCPSSMDEIRKTGGNRVEFTSTKTPDQLSGCIAQAWTFESNASTPHTVKRENGWVVTLRDTNWIFGLADVVEQGKGSKVSFSSNFDIAAKKDLIPKIERCL